MQEGAHQMMGYDRASTMFSPDGRLLQVEYAKEAVKQGSTAIGIVCKNGVVLVADKRVVDKLVVSNSVEKIFQVDNHIGATAVGYVMDGRVLIERSQLISQQHKVTYDEKMDTRALVKEICDIKQSFTQYGGARPFGVSILYIGIDENSPVLYVTEPTGIYFEYKATAVGESSEIAKALLRKEYSESMSTDEGIKLAVKCLKKVLAKEFDSTRLDGAIVDLNTKSFSLIPSKLLK